MLNFECRRDDPSWPHLIAPSEDREVGDCLFGSWMLRILRIWPRDIGDVGVGWDDALALGDLQRTWWVETRGYIALRWGIVGKF